MSASCSCCKRPIAGDSADPMICIVDPADGPMILCGACYQRDLRRADWTRWDPPPDPAMRPMLAEVCS